MDDTPAPFRLITSYLVYGANDCSNHLPATISNVLLADPTPGIFADHEYLPGGKKISIVPFGGILVSWLLIVKLISFP